MDARSVMQLPGDFAQVAAGPCLWARAGREAESMTELVIREAASEEIGEVVDLMRRAFDPQFGEAWTLSQLAGVLARCLVRGLMVARRRNRLLGFALTRSVIDEGELMLIAVDPAVRRAGIATALLADVERVLRASGVAKLHLEVRRGNDATELYRAHGFSKVGERLQYYRGPEGEVFDAETHVLHLVTQE